MKLNQGRRVGITSGFNRTLLNNEVNKRKLFRDVDTFDDLYHRHSEEQLIESKPTNTKQILKKTVKLEVIDYSLENSFKVSDEKIRQIYNRIKNFILSYQDFNCLSSNEEELFLHNDSKVISLTIKSNFVILTYLLLKRNVVYHINNEEDCQRLFDEITQLFLEQSFVKNETYEEKDFLIDYPICENSVIMNEDIIENPPFKEILKK